MPRKKHLRLAEVDTLPNVIPNPFDFKGRWNIAHFKNNNPVALELACGKGEYAIGLARRAPNWNFIGIDMKGARIWRGAKNALEENLANVAFVRLDIEKIGECFSENELSEIWITFPDPFPKSFQTKRRLTSPRFLGLFKTILNPGGIIHLKTDNSGLYEYTLKSLDKEGWKIFEATDDLYAKSEIDEISAIKTTYEKKHLRAGAKIKYIKFGYRSSE